MKYLVALAVLAAPLVAAPSWVERSNADAQVLLDTLGRFQPETASSQGQAAYDSQVVDLMPGVDQRFRAAVSQAADRLRTELAAETDPKVREDLQIMIDAADLQIEDSTLEERDLLPFVDVPKLIFQGEFTLLNDQTPPSRRPSALLRLKRYAGLDGNLTPISELARARYEERLSDANLLPPYKGEVEQGLANSARYTAGVRQLFSKYAISGGDEALAAVEKQMADYDGWVRKVVLPKARTDFRSPKEIYALNLKSIGLTISPDELIGKAELSFSEVTSELQALAPLVAQAHGWSETDYRDVIHRLKQEQLGKAEIEPYYRDVVIPKIEAIIRKEGIATLPDRPMVMRLASEAESAAQPAPHMRAPPLINNHGERGSFILPLGNPPADGDKSQAYDDFTFKAAAWTLTAHEGRPGHELQFSRMVEGGVSLARSIFAFNSVNVEGWALYCEAEMKPYEPLDGQLIVLQLRLLRAVRAIADPELNLGQMTLDRAHEILIRDVCLSEAFAREELDRFTFRTPGQATSYFYGCSRLLELRGATEIALGSKFDHKAFNDFIVSQGLLPPDLLAQAVKTEFIPSQTRSTPPSP